MSRLLHTGRVQNQADYHQEFTGSSTEKKTRKEKEKKLPYKMWPSASGVDGGLAAWCRAGVDVGSGEVLAGNDEERSRPGRRCRWAAIQVARKGRPSSSVGGAGRSRVSTREESAAEGNAGGRAVARAGGRGSGVAGSAVAR